MARILKPGEFTIIGDPPGAPPSSMPDPAPNARILKPGDFRPLTDEEKRARGLPVLGEDDGALMAGLRSAGQAATLGFADELVGLVGGKEARDAERRAVKADAQNHPTATTVGTVAGTLVSAALPGAGAGWVGRGANLGWKAVRSAAVGAGYGAAAGYGGSDAEDAKAQALDTVKGAVGGALVGAALPPVVEGAKKVGGVVAKAFAKKGPPADVSETTPGRIAIEKLREAQQKGKAAFEEEAQRSAPILAKGGAAAGTPEGAVKVAEQAMVDDAMTAVQAGVGTGTKTKIGGRRGEKFQDLEKTFGHDRELRREVGAFQRPEEERLGRALDVTDKRISAHGEKVDRLLNDLQEHTPGVAADEQLDRVLELAKRYKKTDPDAARYIESEANKLLEAFTEHATDATGMSRVPLQDMRKIVSGYQKARWQGGNPNYPGDIQKIDGEIGRALREGMHVEIERASRAAAKAGDDALAVSLPMIRKSNEQLERYIKIQNVLEEQLRRRRTGSPTVGEMMTSSAPPSWYADWLGKAGKTKLPVVRDAADAATSAAEGLHFRGSAWANKRAAQKAAKMGTATPESMAEVDALTPGSPPIAGTKITPEQSKTWARVFGEELRKGTPRAAAIAAANAAAGITFD